MPSAQHLRAQIEATLAQKIPSALTPMARTPSPAAPTGVGEIDRLLHGGFPIGAITEIVGPECSGRTSLALNFVAGLTQAGKVCAWVDVSDALHPESAAAIGVDLARLLWIRCGSTPTPVAHTSMSSLTIAEKQPRAKPGLPQGGSGHPRMEANGLSNAVTDLLGPAINPPRCTESLHTPRPQRLVSAPPAAPVVSLQKMPRSKKPWSRLEQALRVTDLLLQAGGFSCIVLDMGSLQAEYALRVPLATWFRFRAASERLQSNLLLLTQHACSKSSAGLLLRMEPGRAVGQDATIFNGQQYQAELERQRNAAPLRKQPQSVTTAHWQSKTHWAGR